MGPTPAVVGLDLAGSPRRSTGACVLTPGPTARMSVVHEDAEILALCAPLRPGVVVVDAPLSLPRGHRSLEDRSGPHLRVCDRELLNRHIRFFPLTLGPMRMLTARGMLLAERLRGEGWTVIEGYPGGAQDVWGIPRKGTDLGGLRRGLVALGLRFRPAARSLTHDQLDSACCAVVGWQFLRGRALALGDPLEGLLYLPGPGPPLGRRKPPRNRARSEPTRYTHAPRRPR